MIANDLGYWRLQCYCGRVCGRHKMETRAKQLLDRQISRMHSASACSSPLPFRCEYTRCSQLLCECGRKAVGDRRYVREVPLPRKSTWRIYEVFERAGVVAECRVVVVKKRACRAAAEWMRVSRGARVPRNREGALIGFLLASVHSPVGRHSIPGGCSSDSSQLRAKDVYLW